MAKSPAGQRIGTPISDPIEGVSRSATETARRTSSIHRDPIDRGTIPPNEGLSIARRLCAERRLRDKAFEPFVMEGGAWEILLDVFIQGEQGISMPVSGAFLESGVKPTTALRRIAEMEAADMLLRTPDPNDRRRSFLSLSNHAMASMRRYLSMLVPAPPVRQP